MSDLAIQFDDGRRAFEPGEAVRGEAAWLLDRDPAALEVRLFWFTTGKGTADLGVVATTRFDRPLATGRRRFDFTLPRGPYSFSGKLISLAWAVEIVVEPGGAGHREEIVCGPGGVEVRLPIARDERG